MLPYIKLIIYFIESSCLLFNHSALYETSTSLLPTNVFTLGPFPLFIRPLFFPPKRNRKSAFSSYSSSSSTSTSNVIFDGLLNGDSPPCHRKLLIDFPKEINEISTPNALFTLDIFVLHLPTPPPTAALPPPLYPTSQPFRHRLARRREITF